MAMRRHPPLFQLVINHLPKPRAATATLPADRPTPTIQEHMNHLQVLALENPAVYKWYLQSAQETAALLVEEGRTHDAEAEAERVKGILAQWVGHWTGVVAVFLTGAGGL